MAPGGYPSRPPGARSDAVAMHDTAAHSGRRNMVDDAAGYIRWNTRTYRHLAGGDEPGPGRRYIPPQRIDDDERQCVPWDDVRPDGGGMDG